MVALESLEISNRKSKSDGGGLMETLMGFRDLVGNESGEDLKMGMAVDLRASMDDSREMEGEEEDKKRERPLTAIHRFDLGGKPFEDNKSIMAY